MCRLDDYVSAEDFTLNNEDGSTNLAAPFTRSDRDLMVKLIKHIAFIRLYVFGNEPTVANPWSMLLVAKEQNIPTNSAQNYIVGRTFVENEVLEETVRRDPAKFLKTRWLGDNVTLKSPDDLFRDQFFRRAIERIDDDLSKSIIDESSITLWKKDPKHPRNRDALSDEVNEKQSNFSSI